MYVYVAKAKALLFSCAQLICDFAFAYEKKKTGYLLSWTFKQLKEWLKGFIIVAPTTSIYKRQKAYAI